MEQFCAAECHMQTPMPILKDNTELHTQDRWATPAQLPDVPFIKQLPCETAMKMKLYNTHTELYILPGTQEALRQQWVLVFLDIICYTQLN